MRKNPVLIGLILISGFTLSALAMDRGPATQWNRESAMAAVRSTRFNAAIDEIGDVSALADANFTLGRLRDIENRSQWPMPAREAAIYQFTRSLAGFPRDAVAPEVMQYLLAYQPRVLVPHEDHRDALVPLFNIRGAAVGVENAWQRIEYAADAKVQIESDPGSLVSAYAESSNSNQRSGIMDAVRQAEMTDVLAVQDETIERLGDTPLLTGLLAVTAPVTANNFAVQQLLVNGRGAGIEPALVQLDQRLTMAETTALLGFAIQNAPAENTSLAMAAWWPRLSHDPAARDLLIKALGNPELGSSAALALANQPDVQTIKILQEVAAGDGVSARHARMAIGLSREGLAGATRR